MGSCMAHLNSLTPRAAGVSYWFFLLARLVVGVGKKKNAKCEMLLCKIDGEMNVQNGEFSAKLLNGDGGDIIHDWRHAFTSVYVYAIATVVSQLTATAVATHPRHRVWKRWHVAEIKNFTGDDQATLTVDRKSAIYFVYVYVYVYCYVRSEHTSNTKLFYLIVAGNQLNNTARLRESYSSMM